MGFNSAFKGLIRRLRG